MLMTLAPRQGSFKWMFVYLNQDLFQPTLLGVTHASKQQPMV